MTSTDPRVPANGYRPGYRPIQIYLPEEIKRRLSIQAAREQIPYADIVRVAIETELARRGG